MKKRTKIVCTVGPASATKTRLVNMMRAGMNVARLNFSHATHADHRRLMRAIRGAEREVGHHIPIIGDLQGPKIRLGSLPEEGVKLETGAKIVLVPEQVKIKPGILPITYNKLHKDIKTGHRILIEDGIYELIVEQIKGKEVHAKVVNGGYVTSHKGMNFPDTALSVSAFTKKDKEDASFGIQSGVEWFALSFVTSAKEVRQLKRQIKKETPQGVVEARVMVKIEKHEAVTHFEEILEVADGIMIARGDLGVEIPAEDVPIIQKRIIETCRLAGKPVVVATQMLDSMVRNPRPTRAEVSDVANAVFDHADAVMLSGESATGKYPVKAVKMMSQIIQEAERSEYDDVPLKPDTAEDRAGSVSNAIKILVQEEKVEAIIASHALAPWSEALLKTRPEIPLFLAAPSQRVARQLSVHWGVQTWVMKKQDEATFERYAKQALKKRRWVKNGTWVVIVTGGQDQQEITLRQFD